MKHHHHHQALICSPKSPSSPKSTSPRILEPSIAFSFNPLLDQHATRVGHRFLFARTHQHLARPQTSSPRTTTASRASLALFQTPTSQRARTAVYRRSITRIQPKHRNARSSVLIVQVNRSGLVPFSLCVDAGLQTLILKH